MRAWSMEGDVDRNIMGMGGNSVSGDNVCSSEVTSSHPQLEGPVQSTCHQGGWMGEGKGEEGKRRGEWGGEGALLGAVGGLSIGLRCSSASPRQNINKGYFQVQDNKSLHVTFL